MRPRRSVKRWRQLTPKSNLRHSFSGWRRKVAFFSSDTAVDPGPGSTRSHVSNFVLIPCQATLPDVRDAFKTVEQIDDAQELARARIARSLIWSRIMPGFEARSARHVRESVEGKGIPIFKNAVMQRMALAEFHLTGKLPRQTDPKGSAATNMAAITSELLKSLETLAVPA
jgi:chromosome partitioning protein